MDSKERVVALLIEMLPGLVIAVVTAVVTVRLSLRRFYSERWWERKAQAYTDILEALYQSQAYADAFVARTLGVAGRNPPEEPYKELEARSSAAHEKLAHMKALGSFVISEEAARYLDELVERLNKDDDPNDALHETAAKHSALFAEYIKNLRAAAKRDLKVE